MKEKSTDKAVIRWLLCATKGKKRYVGLMILISMITGVTSMGYAVLFSGLIDSAIAGQSDVFRQHALWLILLVVWQFTLGCVSRFLDEFTCASLENTLKKRLFSNILTKDYASVTATHSGEWIHRLTSDVTMAAVSFARIPSGVAGTVTRLISAITLLMTFAPAFTLVFASAGVVVILATWGLRKAIKKLHKDVQIADGKLRVFLTERLGSMMILRAFEQENAAVAQGEVLMDTHKAARMRKNRVSNFFHAGFALAMNSAFVSGAIYCGFGILNGTLSYGTFTAVQQLLGQSKGPIANFSAYFSQYSATLASAERLMEVESYADTPAESAVADMGRFYRESFRSLGLRKACFTYLPVGGLESGEQTRKTVLKNQDLCVSKGEYVAFCGPSGCGKSTVLKLLMCLYELDSGERFLTSDSGEVPLTASWRGLFSYVPQGNQLMSGTIREVVTFADPADMKREADIQRALTIACADKFIAELPDGLDTLLGERGAGLSEGQMQRIAIARAVFSDRPVLLLDEATSALDEATEAQVLDNLRAMTDKTVMIVTHRPKALEITDKTVYFNPDEE